MKKRKRGEKGVEEARGQQALKSKDVRGGQIADAIGRALLLPKDMRAWQGNNSAQMVKNLKRDSVMTERLLNESLIENDQLRELEKTASARVQEVERQHKSAEEGLQTAECQLVEISAKLERECDRSSGLQTENNKLRAELAEAWTAAQNAENAAQAFYDQGFEEATESLRSQLGRECNIYFLRGWVLALEQAAVDNNSKLYALGWEYQPFHLGIPENLEEVLVEGLKDYEAVEDPTDPKAVEDLRHQE
uniref:Uncharacterized protein n=1 Tax=Fagus sylvatica TaxID=28930 RepID=A0A2N9G863_FAGSY